MIRSHALYPAELTARAIAINKYAIWPGFSQPLNENFTIARAEGRKRGGIVRNGGRVTIRVRAVPREDGGDFVHWRGRSDGGLSTPSQPSVTTSRPSVTTSRPSVTTSRPSVTTSRPSVTTSRPSVTTSRPSVTTSRPSGGSTTRSAGSVGGGRSGGSNSHGSFGGSRR